MRKSGFYDIDKIWERMEKLYETKVQTLEEKEEEIDEMQDLLEEKENKIKQMTEDMKAVKTLTAPSYWRGVFPSDLTKRYAGL